MTVDCIYNDDVSGKSSSSVKKLSPETNVSVVNENLKLNKHFKESVQASNRSSISSIEPMIIYNENF